MKDKNLIVIINEKSEEFIKLNSENLLSVPNSDLLIVDDSEKDKLENFIKKNSQIKSIRHEIPLGYGASLLNAIDYARDFDYNAIITLDTSSNNPMLDISLIIENLNYGYDIVNLSRILENHDYVNKKEKYIDEIIIIAENIKTITSYDLTDPISLIKGIKVDFLKNLELTDFDHGIFAQLWIQAAFFDGNIIEIPSESKSTFAKELKNYEDILGYFLSVLETEKYLYKKQTLN